MSILKKLRESSHSNCINIDPTVQRLIDQAQSQLGQQQGLGNQFPSGLGYSHSQMTFDQMVKELERSGIYLRD